MILEFEDYMICTDERQFIVQQKKIVQDSKLTKKENIGKEYWEDIAYCPSLKYALKFLYKKVLLDNDDLTVILSKLDGIENKIKEFLKILKQEEK